MAAVEGVVAQRAAARPIADGIRGVIGTRQLRGHSRQLCWGLSLAWVPHTMSSGTSLHRTAKSARLDLYVEGQFHGARISQDVTREHEAIFIRSDVERAWRNAYDAAERLFARATGAEAVLALAEEQMESDWAMKVQIPGPVYVAAFTLAHLGREAEARARRWSARSNAY